MGIIKARYMGDHLLQRGRKRRLFSMGPQGLPPVCVKILADVERLLDLGDGAACADKETTVGSVVNREAEAAKGVLQ
jgi:hypothetical protein